MRIDVINDVTDELFDYEHDKSLNVSNKSDVCCDYKNNTLCHNSADFPYISMYDGSISYGESYIHDVNDASDFSIAIPHCTNIDIKDMQGLLSSISHVDSFPGTNQAHINSLELLPPTIVFPSIEQPQNWNSRHYLSILSMPSWRRMSSYHHHCQALVAQSRNKFGL